MTKRFFVMVYSSNGESAFPITDSDDDDDIPKFWETAEEARGLMEMRIVGKLGYEIFEMGTGE